jgi:phospholipid/cholesterol/gamma-HCH transport system substrate-binding protein
MDERVMQFRVGVMFLATLLITGILLVMFGKLPTLIGNYYTVQVRFTEAGGVTKDTPVRKSGILIGRVSSVRLTDRDQKVLISMEIQSDKSIYQNEECIVARDLLGDTAVVFRQNPRMAGSGQPIKRDAILDGHVSDDPTGLKRALSEPIDTVTDTGKALTVASKQLGEAAHRVEEILDKDTQENTKAMLRDSAATLQTIRSMLGDEENRKKLTESVRKMPETMDNMNRTFQATEEALRKFTTQTGDDKKSAVDRLVDTIEMTQQTIRQFSESSEPGRPAPADQIAHAMENINEVTSLLRTVMLNIEQNRGSLGLLLNDRQLYDRINRTARNIEELTRDLKPIVADARVFSDKIARHPGSIVRDAVKPGVGIK